jgi:hypothetical protein
LTLIVPVPSASERVVVTVEAPLTASNAFATAFQAHSEPIEPVSSSRVAIPKGLQNRALRVFYISILT